MVGMDACHLVLTYLRMPVVVDFTGGNQVNKQNATYTTDSQFVQDAIENDKRFKIGKIRLISENKIEDEPKAAAPVAAAPVAPAPAPVDGANAPFPAQTEGESTDDLPF